MFDDTVEELFIRYKKLNVSFWGIIAQSCFLFPIEVRLNSTHYLIMKFHNKRELQSIVINHSADIDYKDLMKIYREYTCKSYSFLTIETTSPADNSRRFKKNILESLWKLIKIIDGKIKATQAQYNLDIEAAELSPFSSGELEKYQCLTGDDLGIWV